MNEYFPDTLETSALFIPFFHLFKVFFRINAFIISFYQRNESNEENVSSFFPQVVSISNHLKNMIISKHTDLNAFYLTLK